MDAALVLLLLLLTLLSRLLFNSDSFFPFPHLLGQRLPPLRCCCCSSSMPTVADSVLHPAFRSLPACFVYLCPLTAILSPRCLDCRHALAFDG